MRPAGMITGFRSVLQRPVHIAPLVTLRLVFGTILLLSAVRFIMKGWVKDFYISPGFHFTYDGFHWVRPLGEIGMYGLFSIMALAAGLIILGLFYRVAVLVFFVTFTYVELIDKTYYLNHYYLVSLISFLLLLVPAHRYFSLDVKRHPAIQTIRVPAWTTGIFKLQLFLVYFLAGLSKITSDWLLEALPLKIWLPANSHLPLIGPLLTQVWVAYAFSWFGALFDLSIVFFLLQKSTRPVAYFFVLLFHLFTAWFFKIGMFPFIMLGLSLVFFSEGFHTTLLNNLRRLLKKPQKQEQPDAVLVLPASGQKWMLVLLLVYFTGQLLTPFRYLLYPGKLLWTEQGYRFSWRVMLMEKSGTSFFYVKDPRTGKSSEINNAAFLTSLQIKMMATQPDMILQYAHYLEETYREKGITHPVVTTESYVTLNGSGSRLFIDSSVNLANEREGPGNKKWILPYLKNN